MADQAGGEAEAGGVGRRYRSAEFGHARDLENRREYLLVGDGEASHVEQRRRDESLAAVADAL